MIQKFYGTYIDIIITQRNKHDIKTTEDTKNNLLPHKFQKAN